MPDAVPPPAANYNGAGARLHAFHPRPRFSIAGFEPADMEVLGASALAMLEEAAGRSWHDIARLTGKSGPAWTARWDGRVIVCAGFNMLWRGRASAWCILAQDVPSAAWHHIHHATQVRLRQMRAANVWRIEADTRADFKAGNRWLRMLGFKLEGLAPAFGPDASDFNRYGRVTR